MNNKENQTWYNIDWKQINHKIELLQSKISQASLLNQVDIMYDMQHQLVNSVEAKFLCVHTMSNTAHTYFKHKVHLSDSLKFKLSLALSIHSTPSNILEEIIIKETINIDGQHIILELIKLCLHELILMTIKPQWNPLIKKHAYLFQENGSPISLLKNTIEDFNDYIKYNHQQWAYTVKVDLEFNKNKVSQFINQTNTLASICKQMTMLLDSGFFIRYFNDDLIRYKQDRESCYKLFLDIFFHNLYSYMIIFNSNIIDTIGTHSKIKNNYQLTFIRSHNQLLISHVDSKILYLSLMELQNWLKLRIGESEDLIGPITNLNQSIEFMGFQIIRVYKDYKYKIKIFPSLKEQKILLQHVKVVVKSHQASTSYKLILALKPILLRWGFYYNHCNYKFIYRKLDHLIFLKLKRWVFRRDNRSARSKLKEKYFPSNQLYEFDNNQYRSSWVLVGRDSSKKDDDKFIFLPHLAWIKRSH